MFYKSVKAAKIACVIFAALWTTGMVFALVEYASFEEISFLSMIIIILATIGVNDSRISVEILKIQEELKNIRR